jgi:hypothetical protein
MTKIGKHAKESDDEDWIEAAVKLTVYAFGHPLIYLALAWAVHLLL